MNAAAPSFDPRPASFDRTYAACVEHPGAAVGPTGAPDVGFKVRLLGAADLHTAADCAKPLGAANPGWLMPLVDLLLARGALTPDSPHSCVTVRIDLTIDAQALSRTGSVRGLGSHGATADTLSIGTCELRDADGVWLGAATGMFVDLAAPLPNPFVNPTAGIAHSSLTELLELEHHTERGSATWPIREWTTNPSSVVHGGVQAAALFAAIEEYAAVDSGDAVTFGQVGVEFRAPVPVDATTLTIEVRRRRLGRRFATYEADLLSADGRVATTASATLRRMTDQ